MTGTQRSGLLLGLGMGLMLAALLLWLQVGVQQAVKVPSNPAPSPASSGPAVPSPATRSSATAAPNPAAPTTAPAATAPGATADPAPPADVVISVAPDEDFGTVALALKQAGLISDRQAFLVKVKEQEAAGRLQVGTYFFKPGTTETDILKVLITVH